jgi:hypothetical protein
MADCNSCSFLVTGLGCALGHQDIKPETICVDEDSTLAPGLATTTDIINYLGVDLAPNGVKIPRQVHGFLSKRYLVATLNKVAVFEVPPYFPKDREDFRKHLAALGKKRSVFYLWVYCRNRCNPQYSYIAVSNKPKDDLSNLGFYRLFF